VPASENSSPRRRKGVGAKLALALASTVLTLLAAEFVARSVFPHVVPAPVTGGDMVEWRRVFHQSPSGKRLIPNSHVIIRNQLGTHRKIELEINALGFRDDPLPIPKPKGEFRILALGDSITFAAHLPADQSYVERLQHHLNRGSRDVNYEVINAGIGDIGITTEVNILERPGLSTEPDVVLVGFYLNDSRPPWGFPNELVNPGWLRRHSVLADTIYRRLKLNRWIERQGESRFAWVEAVPQLAWREDRDAFLSLARLAKYDWGAAWQEESWKIVDRAFARIEKMSEENGFRVLLVPFPVSYQLHASFLEDTPQQILRQKAAELDWDFYDLLPRFRELETELIRTGANRRVLIDSCHPTAETFDEVGRLLATHLRERLLPDAPGHDAGHSARSSLHPADAQIPGGVFQLSARPSFVRAVFLAQR